MGEQIEWYRSKVDGWMVGVLWLMPLITIGVLLIFVVTGNYAELPWAVGSCLFVVALYGGLVLSMRYGISSDQLIVRFGLVRVRVPVASISTVEPTSNPISSPALSLDRVSVQYDSKELIISPDEREQFLQTLAERAGLRREGDRLVR
ncbi:MAG: PH domain-containing protein [Polyangiaceae bacterium]|nr:PH domain-containing protein [Polyangiaceae bacterium]MCW5790001.1 PH domain-containing protein [Polyangiaceae bacterium]